MPLQRLKGIVMEQKKFVRSVYEVDVYGQVFKLKKPTYRENKEFSDKYKAAQNDVESAEILVEFLETCGLPKETSYELEMEHLTEVLNLITGVKKN